MLDFDPTTALDPVELRRVPRMIPLALAASREALAMARLDIDPQNIEQQRIASELCRVSGKPSSIGAWECNLANVSLSWTDGVYDLFFSPHRLQTIDMRSVR